MQAYADKARNLGRRIALVPTMGFLHKGHLSLIEEAGKHGDEIVVSIFVNPAQFGPGEDLDAYPRAFGRDCSLCRDAGATAIFSPDTSDLYGPGYQTFVNLEKLPDHLCGLSRPVHFRGVATVVTKLFNITKPHAAIFGLKDFQQVLVIRRMVKDLNFDVNIIGAPIVREPDGLAMSSRNAYLTPEQREQAICLYQALLKARDLFRNGERDARKLADAAQEIICSRPDTTVDYISVCDAETLDPVQVADGPALMALAVRIGKARLIDNMILE